MSDEEANKYCNFIYSICSNQKYTHLKPGTSATRKQTLVNQPADSKWEWD